MAFGSTRTLGHSDDIFLGVSVGIHPSKNKLFLFDVLFIPFAKKFICFNSASSSFSWRCPFQILVLVVELAFPLLFCDLYQLAAVFCLQENFVLILLKQLFHKFPQRTT